MSTPPRSKQACPLLDLPHNVRHFIYGRLLDLEPAVTVRDGTAAPHPCAQACQTLRTEFLPRWQDHVKKNATEFRFEVIDFDFSDAKVFVQKLSLLQPTDCPRKLFIHFRLSHGSQNWAKRTIDAFDDWKAWLESRSGRLRVRGQDCGLWYGFDFEVNKQYVEAVERALGRETAEYARMRPVGMLLHRWRVVQALRKAYNVGDEIVEEMFGKRREMTLMERDLWDRILRIRQDSR